MGNKESLIFVYYLNCAVCILFGIIGLVMYFSSAPALRMIHYLPFGLDTIPEDVEHTTRVENFLEQRRMYRYTVFMSVVCFILILFSTFIRICVTMDTIEAENALAEQ